MLYIVMGYSLCMEYKHNAQVMDHTLITIINNTF